MEVRLATEEDLKYIVSVAKKDTDAVGFLPKMVYERAIGANKRPCEKLDICVENGDNVGFCYSTRKNGVVKVQQLVVQKDARRNLYATALIESAPSFYDSYMAIRCAVDLNEANAFWLASGFEPIKVIQGGKARDRKIQCYGKT